MEDENTYNCLMETHYSDTDTYRPVDVSDVAGSDLKTMTEELTNKLNDVVRRVWDPNVKKLIKSFIPSGDVRFPEGRVNLKTHKPGVTHLHCPVRPIVSNTDSPTAALASFLGKTLSKNLGEVSGKHVGSVEQFAERMRSYPTDGKLISLDVVNLFSSILVPEVIKFLRNQSDAGVNAHLTVPNPSSLLYITLIWTANCFATLSSCAYLSISLQPMVVSTVR